MREMHRPGTKGMMSHNDVELPHQRKVAIIDPGPVHHQVVVVEPARGLGVPGACNRGNQNGAQNGITTGSGGGGVSISVVLMCKRPKMFDVFFSFQFYRSPSGGVCALTAAPYGPARLPSESLGI